MAPVPEGDEPFRVHVTGFGPFRSIAENPSWLAVQQLEGVTLSHAPTYSSGTTPPVSNGQASKRRRIKISTELVPVTYDDVNERVPHMHGLKHAQSDRAARADMILHCGVGHEAVKLEGLGRKGEYNGADAKGDYLPGTTQEGGRYFVVPDDDDEKEAKEEYRTTIDRRRVTEWVNDRGPTIQLSQDAGLYLCEYILYSSLRAADIASRKSGEPARPVMFIHVGPVDKPYSTSETVDILKMIIWAIVNERGLPGQSH